MAVFAFRTSRGFVLGADADHVFFMLSYDGNLADALGMDAAPQKLLDAASTVIPRADVKYVQAIEKEGFPIWVQGTKQNIGFGLDDVKGQAGFVRFVAERWGFRQTESRAGLMQAAPELVFATILAAVVTVGGALLASSSEEMEFHGRRAGAKKLLSAALQAIGAPGILLIGGLGTAVLAYLVYVQYSKDVRVVRLLP